MILKNSIIYDLSSQNREHVLTRAAFPIVTLLYGILCLRVLDNVTLLGFPKRISKPTFLFEPNGNYINQLILVAYISKF